MVIPVKLASAKCIAVLLFLFTSLFVYLFVGFVFALFV